jgi:beta-mannosidase
VGHAPVTLRIPVPDAQLWWPNGMGAQPLYRVTARVLHEGAECDRREFRIGLRTVEIDRAPLPEGSRFCVRVNGEDVFCKGGNWIPADAILARAGRAKVEALIEAARAANFTMLRVWGGGVYEDPAFYEACDRAGILVWQDFLFACMLYPDYDAGFRAAVRTETETAVRRLRHHPCIALWSGNNENTWGMAEWWGGELFEGHRRDGQRLYNEILPDVCRTLDPARPYWPSSPFGGPTPNCETDGDCHWWHPFTMNPDIGRRIRHEVFDECKARFVSEYGVIGPLGLDSVADCLKPGERTPASRAWKVHTNTFEKETLPAAIRRHYAEPEGLAVKDYVLFGQLFQAQMYGGSVEALRFRKGDSRDDCQGALIWMYADCWGETGWTLVDYYLRRKASYYAFRRACAPVKAIVRQRGGALVTRVVNDTLAPVEAELACGWTRLDGREARLRQRRVRVPANGMVEVAREALPAESALDRREWIYLARLSGAGLEDAPSLWLGRPVRELALARPQWRAEPRGDAVELCSPVFCHAVHAEDRGRALLSDNYFDLLPGVPKRVRRLDGGRAAALRFRAVVSRGAPAP